MAVTAVDMVVPVVTVAVLPVVTEERIAATEEAPVLTEGAMAVVVTAELLAVALPKA